MRLQRIWTTAFSNPRMGRLDFDIRRDRLCVKASLVPVKKNTEAPCFVGYAWSAIAGTFIWISDASQMSQEGLKAYSIMAYIILLMDIHALSLLAHLLLKVLAVITNWGSKPLTQPLDVAQFRIEPWWGYPVRSFFGSAMIEPTVP